MGTFPFISRPLLLFLFFALVGNVASAKEDSSTITGLKSRRTTRLPVRYTSAHRRQADGECPVQGFSACPQGLPTNFCCPPTFVCHALAANTTAICCPPGKSYDSVEPTTCDIQQMNVTAHPSSPILTLALTSQLVTCGQGCCPFGYECGADGNCTLSADQSSFTTGASPSSTVVTIDGSPSPTEYLTGPTDSSPSNSTSEPPASSNKSGVVAGVTTAVIFSVLVLSALGWAKRGTIAQFSRRHRPNISWPPMSEHRRPPTPPPKSPAMLFARNSRFEWKTAHPPLKSISPVELPVELPATPLTLSFWHVKRHNRPSRPKPAVLPPENRGSGAFPGFI